MKKLLFLFLLLPFICTAQTQAIDVEDIKYSRTDTDYSVIKIDKAGLRALKSDTGYSAYGSITGKTKYVSFQQFPFLFKNHILTIFINSKIEKSVTVTITNSLEEVISQNYIKLKKGKNTFTPLTVFYPGEYIIKVKE